MCCLVYCFLELATEKGKIYIHTLCFNLLGENVFTEAINGMFLSVTGADQKGRVFYTAVLENRLINGYPEGRIYLTSLALTLVEVTISVGYHIQEDVTVTLNPGDTYLYKVKYMYHLKANSFSFNGKIRWQVIVHKNHTIMTYNFLTFKTVSRSLQFFCC